MFSCWRCALESLLVIAASTLGRCSAVRRASLRNGCGRDRLAHFEQASSSASACPVGEGVDLAQLLGEQVALCRCRHNAYLLKEQLRLVFQEPDAAAAIALLDAWLAWARRCRIPSFVKLAKTIREHYNGIVATLTHRLTNARTEAVNTTLRLICRRAYGFHSAQALIALAMPRLGGLCRPLPGRSR